MNKKGFTLVEALAVIVILSLLVTLTSVSIINIKKKQDKKNDENVISSILTGARQYYADNKKVPSVTELKNGDYVNFNKSKLKIQIEDNISIESCAEKMMFKLKTKDGTIYTDCGCDVTQNGNETKNICIE